MLAQVQPQKQHQHQLRKEEGCSTMYAPAPQSEDQFQAAAQDQTNNADESDLYVTYDSAF